MNIELTPVQVEMLQALLDMTVLHKDLSPEDGCEFYNLHRALDVDNAFMRFEADSLDCVHGIELWRNF